MTEQISHLLREGNQLLRAGSFHEAEALYREVLKASPSHAMALHQLGVIAHAEGRSNEAVELLERAAAAAPENELFQNNLGVVLEETGKHEAAATAYAAALAIAPQRGRIHFNLGNALRTLGRSAEAIACYERAAALDNNDPDPWLNLGSLMRELARLEEAESFLRRALAIAPRMVDAQVNLGATLQTLGRNEEARDCYRRALEVQPGCLAAVAGEASIELRNGDPGMAARRLAPALEMQPDDPEVATVFAALAHHLGREGEAAETLERVLQRRDLLRSKRQTLLFSLGGSLDRTGRYEEAFARYQEAHALQRRSFDFAAFSELVQRLIETFSAEFFTKAVRAEHESQWPVFVIGMPRSGTSLVEQILASHPEVYGAGELDFVERLSEQLPGLFGSGRSYPECLYDATQEGVDRAAATYLEETRKLAPNAERIIDKMPGNFVHAGLIALLFPEARIIHVRRDPLDTCLSCYFQQFSRGHEYAGDLKMLGRVYREYERLVAHWRAVAPIRWLELRYETLVAQQEPETRRLLEFCGLSWEPRCLTFHETPRPVRTASYDQVRQPLYSRSAGRHRHYARFLGPLKAALEGRDHEATGNRPA